MCMLTAIYPMRQLLAWEKKAGMLLLTEILSANSSTGNQDATGLGALDGTVRKWEESAQTLVYTNTFNEVIRRMITHPLIAHVRTTSSGLTATDGAHPFHVGQILLAHNGTLFGYQKFIEKYASVLNDADPVDSHILTCILAQTCGTKEVTPEFISEALKELAGSYTLLIIDTSGPRMWAVLGSNPLHTMVVGPYFVVNTSGANLRIAASLTAAVTELLYKKSLTLGEVTAIPGYTINTISTEGATKVGVAPKLTLPQARTYTGHLPWSGYRQKETAATKAAEGVFSIISDSWATMWEITTACDTMDVDHWWEMNEDEIEILRATLAEITMEPTLGQTAIWAKILRHVPPQVNPYTFLGDLLDLDFPYPLNSKDRLSSIYNQIKKV